MRQFDPNPSEYKTLYKQEDFGVFLKLSNGEFYVVVEEQFRKKLFMCSDSSAKGKIKHYIVIRNIKKNSMRLGDPNKDK